MNQVPPLIFKPHRFQSLTFNSTSKITLYISGIQSGKTTLGSMWHRRWVEKFGGPDDNHLICLPDYKILSQSALPMLRRVHQYDSEYRASDDVFKMQSGCTVYLRSMVDPDSCEGLTNVRSIWVDEAGKISYRAWQNIYARSAFLKCPILLTSTPYSLNWLYREIYLPAINHQVPESEIRVIQCRSIDNPYFPQDEIERQRKILDPRIFRMKFLGSFEKLEGLVFEDYDMVLNRIEPFKIDKDKYIVVAGVDVGFSDPFVVLPVAISRDGKQVIVIGEFYKPFTSYQDRINVCKQYMQVYGISQFWVDSAHPTDIQALSSAGIPATGVDKFKDSVSSGISMMTTLIRERRLRVMDGRAPHLLDEFGLYSYGELDNTSENSNKREKPLDINNHSIDSLRYVCISMWSTISAFEKSQEYHYEKTHLQRVLAGEFDTRNRDDDWYNN